MKRKIIYTVFIMAACIAGYIYYRVSKPRPSLKDATPALTIDAAELFKQYQTNEVKADSQFLDKVIEVTGIITDIQSTDSTLSIELKGGETGGINCGIAGGNKENSLITGSTVFIKGKCSGFLMDVTLSDCVIEDKKQ
jgi:putative nucleic acid binding protein